MDITHDNVCSSMLSCFYSHLLSTGRPISSFKLYFVNRTNKTIYVFTNLKLNNTVTVFCFCKRTLLIYDSKKLLG